MSYPNLGSPQTRRDRSLDRPQPAKYLLNPSLHTGLPNGGGRLFAGAQERQGPYGEEHHRQQPGHHQGGAGRGASMLLVKMRSDSRVMSASATPSGDAWSTRLSPPFVYQAKFTERRSKSASNPRRSINSLSLCCLDLRLVEPQAWAISLPPPLACSSSRWMLAALPGKPLLLSARTPLTRMSRSTRRWSQTDC
jgi:hypothetical protein